MRKFNKVVACLLTGAMALSMVGCASADGTGTSTASTEASVSTETSVSEETSTEASTEASVEETVEEVVKPESITVMWDGTIFKEGDNYAEAFYDALSEKLGIEINWIRPDHSTYSEQVAIAFTDQSTLADVVILPANLYSSYASQGNLWNMTDAWLNSDTANSGRLTDAAAQVIDSWYVTGPDGEKGIYGFYPARGNGCITYISAAWATAAGYTEDTLPTTWEEYQTFLLALKDANDGKAPVLAAGGLYNSEAPYTNYLPEFWQDAYPDFYQAEDGTWVDGFTEDKMAEALDRIAWGYSNGVINSAILENLSTSDVRNKYFYAGETGVFTYWAGTWAYNNKTNLEKNDLDGTCWELEPIAELGTYKERMSPMICITSACENPEGVFKYFIDTMLDGGDVQMLWQYGVEGVHYEWNEDHTAITGLATEATKGTEKESKTSKNLFEANLKLANFVENDPYTPADPVIDESFNLFNTHSSFAPAPVSSDVYNEYSATLWTEKQELSAAVAKGEMTGAEAVAKYIEDCGSISEAVIASFN